VSNYFKDWRLSGLLAVMLVAGLILAGCGGQQPGGTTGTPEKVTLNGAGASFPYPLYSKWFDEYKKKTNEAVTINYQSIGSGGGIKNITDKTVDFGASDAPMKDDQLQKAPGELFHIPTVMGAVVVTFNLEGVSTGLKMSPETVAGIFLGEIKKWNDPKLTSINPGVQLPDKDIVVVHRSDGSGTTNIFTDYLSSVSPAWKEKVGKGTSVEWPAGVGAKGNEGVSGQVKQTPGGVGYVELAYAVENKLPYAFIQNKDGKFVEPTIESTTAAAAAAAASMPADMRVSIVNPPGADSYPISGYTYLLVYKNQDDQTKGKALVDFLWWAVHDGEKFARDLLYAPLPDNVVKLAENKIKQINYQGKQLLQQ
jgi:phosphate transport system substrate-binding protein